MQSQPTHRILQVFVLVLCLHVYDSVVQKFSLCLMKKNNRLFIKTKQNRTTWASSLSKFYFNEKVLKMSSCKCEPAQHWGFTLSTQDFISVDVFLSYKVLCLTYLHLPSSDAFHGKCKLSDCQFVIWSCFFLLLWHFSFRSSLSLTLCWLRGQLLSLFLFFSNLIKFDFCIFILSGLFMQNHPLCYEI